MSAFVLIPMVCRQHFADGVLPEGLEREDVTAFKAAIATCVHFRLPPERLGTLVLPNDDIGILTIGPGGELRVLAIARTDIEPTDLDRAFKCLVEAQYFSEAPFPPHPGAGELQ